MNLIEDSIHNFIDGVIISAGFMASTEIEITTFIAIAAHEIPQEIGDLGVLIYGGFKKKKAIILNFIAALFIVVGGVVGYFIPKNIGQSVIFLLPFAAGGFLYIAATDLVPEIKKETNIRKSMITTFVFIFGIILMWIVRILFHH